MRDPKKSQTRSQRGKLHAFAAFEGAPEEAVAERDDSSSADPRALRESAEDQDGLHAVDPWKWDAPGHLDPSLRVSLS